MSMNTLYQQKETKREILHNNTKTLKFQKVGRIYHLFSYKQRFYEQLSIRDALIQRICHLYPKFKDVLAKLTT